MKPFCFVLYIFLMLKVTAIGQHADTINLPNYIPLKCGYIKKNNDTSTSFYINPIKGIQIFTCDPNNDSVYSISQGKVLAIEKIDDEYVCVIKTSQMILTYSSLSSSPLEKGMNIEKGDYIGKIYKDFSKKLLRIVIRKDDKVLNYDKHLFYIINSNPK